MLYDNRVSGAEVVDHEGMPITVIALTSWIMVPASRISACPVTFNGDRDDTGRLATNAALIGACSTSVVKQEIPTFFGVRCTAVHTWLLERGRFDRGAISNTWTSPINSS